MVTYQIQCADAPNLFIAAGDTNMPYWTCDRARLATHFTRKADAKAVADKFEDARVIESRR